MPLEGMAELTPPLIDTEPAKLHQWPPDPCSPPRLGHFSTTLTDVTPGWGFSRESASVRGPAGHAGRVFDGEFVRSSRSRYMGVFRGAVGHAKATRDLRIGIPSGSTQGFRSRNPSDVVPPTTWRFATRSSWLLAAVQGVTGWSCTCSKP